MNLTTLLTNCRNYLGDALTPPQTWTDAQLTLWINAAISAYSIHFPRRLDTSLEATAGVETYNLPANIRGIISVEYQPGGISTVPPSFFKQHDHMLDDFYTTDEVYDWKKLGNSSSASAPSTITFNPVTPSDADAYVIEYLGDHSQLANGADIVSIPDKHMGLIQLHMRWSAIMELSTGVKKFGSITPGGGGGTIYQPYSEIDLKRTFEAYNTALKAAIKAESESHVVHWNMDKYGRIT